MTKPDFEKALPISKLNFQTYERYLPTAFDDTLSILQKMNKMIYKLNEIGIITNHITNQWNALIDWILSNGLEEIVEEKINEMFEDGTFNQIIQEIIGDLSLLETTDKTTIVNAINEVFEICVNNRNNIGLLELLETINKETLVDAINEIKNRQDIESVGRITIGESTGRGVISGFNVTQQPVLALAVQIGNSSTMNIAHANDGKRWVIDSTALPIDNPDLLPRYDLVYIDENGELQVLKGTPSTNPVKPKIEHLWIPLAYVIVQPNDTTINNADITDIREMKSMESLLTNEKANLVVAINEIILSLDDVINNAIGNIENLTTSEKSTIVGAINELDGEIGDLSTLKTTIKTNIVNAINDLFDNTNTLVGVLSELKTDVKTNIVEAINNLFDKTNTDKNSVLEIIGNLELLPTVDKTSIVNAIIEVVFTQSANKDEIISFVETVKNELIDEILELSIRVGENESLITVDKTTIVNAINETYLHVTTKVNEIVGDLNELPTTDKTNIVNAIKEIFNSLDGVVNISLGDINNLNTDDKTNVVNAINEVNTRTKTKMNRDSLFISVKDFGAVGDGVTDDTDAIQRAIDSTLSYVATLSGALVFLPAGKYLVSKPIQLYANLTLMGVGRRGSTLILKAGSTAAAVLERKSVNVGYWTQIRDLCIDGQASQQTVDAVGILLQNSTECYINNVGIRFMRGHGIRIYGSDGGQSIQPTVQDCIIRADINHHAINSAGILLDDGSYDGMITGNDVGFYKTGYGLRMVGHNGAYLANNNMWQNKNGYSFRSCYRIRIANCLSDYAQEVGFDFNQCFEVQISNSQSRWSSNKVGAIQLYDGFNIYNSSHFILTGCAVYGGDGSTLIDGGEGRTAFAIAFTGTTNIVQVIGLMTRNVKGKYYYSANAIDIEIFEGNNSSQSKMLNGTSFVGTGSQTVNVTFVVQRVDANYSVAITPTWDSGMAWVTNVTKQGFTINFTTAPTAGKNCYWIVAEV